MRELDSIEYFFEHSNDFSFKLAVDPVTEITAADVVIKRYLRVLLVFADIKNHIIKN